MLVSSTADTSRFDANASQIMKIINITAVSEMNEPIEEIVFHAVYASDNRSIVEVFRIVLESVVERMLYLLLRI